MKAFVLEMFFIVAGQPVPPPALSQFDTMSQCQGQLASWADRTMRAHPKLQAQTAMVGVGTDPGRYPVMYVGQYLAMCLPSSLVNFKDEWKNNSP